jgi:pimeloyl-ACP methyl ester carboxylesterase
MRRILTDSFAEAVRSGGAGMAADTRYYLTSPRTNADRLRMPVFIWHGGKDTTVPSRMGTELARRLPHARLFLLADEGHYSLPLNHHRSILERLVADQRP